MKKILTLCICLMLATTLLLSGCSGDNNADSSTPNIPSALKFGAGVYVGDVAATDATADTNGSGAIDVTIAAVTIDGNGKIVACALDTSSNTVEYTADGKAVANTSFKTKYEMGDDYKMVAYGGAKQEWYKQADAFEALVVGKTLAQVKALVAEGNKGTQEVVNAGCSIMINEFVGAIEKAYNSATASTVSAADTLKVTAYTEQECVDADGDKDGYNSIATTFFAAAVNSNGQVVAASSDCVEVEFTFNAQGSSTYDTTDPVLSKKQRGDDYKMVAYGGAKQEWYKQAAVFDAACLGKTAAQIVALMANDGKGVESLQTAGCTIYVTGFVKAASKI